jgi:hypothetical protein
MARELVVPEVAGTHAGRDHQIVKRNLTDARARGGRFDARGCAGFSRGRLGFFDADKRAGALSAKGDLSLHESLPSGARFAQIGGRSHFEVPLAYLARPSLALFQSAPKNAAGVDEHRIRFPTANRGGCDLVMRSWRLRCQ